MEIRFVFDKQLSFNIISELKAKYNFDTRNGLNFIMIGEHWSEIEDENRLIRQIEKLLHVNLNFMDYWNPEFYDKEIEIDELILTLKNLRIQTEKFPDFYENISYGFDLVNRYFKPQFFNDVLFLIEFFQLTKDNGALTVKYETE